MLLIKLVGIELRKIFMHKVIYFIYFIVFLFCLFNNLLYKLDYDSDGRYKYDYGVDVYKNINDLERKLNKYNVSDKNDLNIYVTTKSKLDVYKGMSRYDRYSWQYIKFNDYMYDLIYNINFYSYIVKDNVKVNDYTLKYNEFVTRFDKNDYKYFINIEKNNLLDKLHLLENDIKNTDDKELRVNLERELDKCKNDLLIVNYRINNNISYSNNYLNRSLNNYYDSIIERNSYKGKRLVYADRVNYNNVVSNLYLNKYVIDNSVNLYKENSINNQLRNITLDYEVFIVVMILIVSGILIGEEFNKGTIKLLLIKPYRRESILISKLFAGVIMIVITILFLIICELLLGSVFLGFGDIGIPVVVYDFNIGSIRELNIFVYMFVMILARLPMFIFMLLFCMLFGIISGNSTLGFAVGMIIYSFSSVINNLIVSNNIKIFKYLFTMNWEFSSYLFGGINNFRYLSFKNSFLIYVIYVIILLVIMIINFNRKDIKNM